MKIASSAALNKHLPGDSLDVGVWPVHQVEIRHHEAHLRAEEIFQIIRLPKIKEWNFLMPLLRMQHIPATSARCKYSLTGASAPVFVR